MAADWATLFIAAPEVISGSKTRYSGESADVWSCGVFLFVMLFHCYPFERSSDPKGAKGAKIVGFSPTDFKRFHSQSLTIISMTFQILRELRGFQANNEVFISFPFPILSSNC